MKTIKGNLVLTKDTIFNESIRVEGNITCKGGWFNITVHGDIDAHNVGVCDIIAHDIIAHDIDACDIDAYDITARDIICDKRIKKHKNSKTMAYNIVTDRFSRECKEQMPEAIE